MGFPHNAGPRLSKRRQLFGSSERYLCAPVRSHLIGFTPNRKLLSFVGGVVRGSMSSRKYKFQFAGPDKLRALQEIFDTAWQEINASNVKPRYDSNANSVRDELAVAIMSVCNLDPAIIKEDILQKIQSGSFRRYIQAA